MRPSSPQKHQKMLHFFQDKPNLNFKTKKSRDENGLVDVGMKIGDSFIVNSSKSGLEIETKIYHIQS